MIDIVQGLGYWFARDVWRVKTYQTPTQFLRRVRSGATHRGRGGNGTGADRARPTNRPAFEAKRYRKGAAFVHVRTEQRENTLTAAHHRILPAPKRRGAREKLAHSATNSGGLAVFVQPTQRSALEP